MLRPITLVLALLASCATIEPPPTPPEPGLSEAGAPVAWLPPARLEPFRPGTQQALMPEINRATGAGEYSLVYVLSDDRSQIQTRFKGAAHPLSVGLVTEVVRRARAGQLHATVAGTDVRVLLAEWQLDGLGHITNAQVRLTPVLEFRTLNEEASPPPLEWRFLNEKAWRR